MTNAVVGMMHNEQLKLTAAGDAEWSADAMTELVH